MTSTNFKGLLAGATLAVVASVYTMPAAAATCDASASYLLAINDAGTPPSNDGCEVGSTNNDFVSTPLQVNVDSLFGFTDWVFAGKELETSTGGIDIGFTASGNTFSGTWQVASDLFDNYDNLMIVAKGGNGAPIRPQEYVGYLFNSATSGDYSSPFSNINSGNTTAISHLTAYVQGDGNPGGGGGTTVVVPLPAGLPLILTGLGVFGALGLRKRKTA